MNGLRDLRRGQILIEARNLVAEGGLGALTIGALEQRLPFTRGVITHHFVNKDAIVQAVLQSAVDEIDAATRSDVRAAGTFADRVEAVLRSKILGFLACPEASWILLSFFGRVRSDPASAAVASDLFARYRRQSADLLVWGQGRGDVPANVDRAAFAANLVGVVIGVVAQALMSPRDIPVEPAIIAGAQGAVASVRRTCEGV